MDRKTFLCTFSRWFSDRFREITYAKTLENQKASFVSPSTKELQRKQLVTVLSLSAGCRRNSPAEKVAIAGWIFGRR